jgi:hypothetical protein
VSDHSLRGPTAPLAPLAICISLVIEVAPPPLGHPRPPRFDCSSSHTLPPAVEEAPPSSSHPRPPQSHCSSGLTPPTATEEAPPPPGHPRPLRSDYSSVSHRHPQPRRRPRHWAIHGLRSPTAPPVSHRPPTAEEAPPPLGHPRHL